MHRTCKNTSVKPDRHCEKTFHFVARRKESPKWCDHLLCNSIQVRHYGSFFLARRTESPTDVTTSYATASRCVTTVPFHGEPDRITKWCDHQLCNSIQVAGGHISWWFCPSRQEKGTVVTHLDAVAKLVVTSFGDSVRFAMKWNRSDAPGCCCIAGGHISWWFCPSRQEKGTVVTHLDAVANSWWSHHLVILSGSPWNGTVVTHLDAVA